MKKKNRRLFKFGGVLASAELPPMCEAYAVDLETGSHHRNNQASESFCARYPTVVAVARRHELRSEALSHVSRLIKRAQYTLAHIGGVPAGASRVAGRVLAELQHAREVCHSVQPGPEYRHESVEEFTDRAKQETRRWIGKPTKKI